MRRLPLPVRKALSGNFSRRPIFVHIYGCGCSSSTGSCDSSVSRTEVSQQAPCTGVTSKQTAGTATDKVRPALVLPVIKRQNTEPTNSIIVYRLGPASVNYTLIYERKNESLTKLCTKLLHLNWGPF